MSKISKIIEKKVSAKRETLVKGCVRSGRSLISSSKDFHKAVEKVRYLKRSIKNEQKLGNGLAVSLLAGLLRDAKEEVKSYQSWLAGQRTHYGNSCKRLREYDELVEAILEANPKSGAVEKYLAVIKA